MGWLICFTLLPAPMQVWQAAPKHIQSIFHLPLEEGCESGMAAAAAEGDAYQSVWISDDQGRSALMVNGWFLSGQ